MRKTSKFTGKYLDKLIGEATTDAYNESEQAGGFLVTIEENLALPFVTQLLGQKVTVTKIDIEGLLVPGHRLSSIDADTS